MRILQKRMAHLRSSNGGFETLPGDKEEVEEEEVAEETLGLIEEEEMLEETLGLIEEEKMREETLGLIGEEEMGEVAEEVVEEEEVAEEVVEGEEMGEVEMGEVVEEVSRDAVEEEVDAMEEEVDEDKDDFTRELIMRDHHQQSTKEKPSPLRLLKKVPPSTATAVVPAWSKKRSKKLMPIISPVRSMVLSV